jgi:GTPase SAR1 family protein
MNCSYFRGAYGAIVVYDITDKKSFDNVEHWVNKIREIAIDNVVILLIGNKLDRAGERKVRHLINSQTNSFQLLYSKEIII